MIDKVVYNSNKAWVLRDISPYFPTRVYKPTVYFMMRSTNERVEIPSLKIFLDVSRIENNGDKWVG